MIKILCNSIYFILKVSKKLSLYNVYNIYIRQHKNVKLGNKSCATLYNNVCTLNFLRMEFSQ